MAAPEPDGAVQTLMNFLEELATRDVELVCFGHPSVAGRLDDVPVASDGYFHRSQPFGVIWERTVLPWLASRHEVDVLFCPNGNAPMHRTSYPVVVQIHDIGALKGYSSRLHRTYRRLAIPRSVGVSDAIVTVSDFSKREIVNTLGTDPAEVYVAQNGLHPSFHDAADGSPIDLPASSILYVGAMNPRKNVEGLVRAYRHLKRETDVPHELVLIGPTNKRLYGDLAIEAAADVHVKGFRQRAEVRYALKHADLFAFPSLYEGFGLPPLEAMACGTPVVASEAAALPEVLGQAAEFVDPTDVGSIADGLQTVLEDRSYAAELVRRGRDRSAKFTWKRYADTVLDVFERLR